MTSMVSFVQEVEEAIASRDSARRVETLRRLATLFVDQEIHLRDEQIEVFDEVLLRLVRDLEQRARLELAERFAALRRAPEKVIRNLAFDRDGAVARPVLEHSPRLRDDDLVLVARARGQSHLLAISRRAELSERVTDVLVERGDEEVALSVAANDGARFSSGGIGELVDRAGSSGTLRAVLESRRDIPPQSMARLMAVAQEQARRRLVNELGSEAAQDVAVAVSGAAEAIGYRGSAPEAMGAAMATVQRKAASGTLSEEDVIEAVREGRVEEALAAVAHLAGTPLEVVMRAYRSPHYDPLLFILRSLRFGWGTFKAILAAKAGQAPQPETLRSAFAAFQQLSVQTAQRVVRFTTARERASQAGAA